MLLGLPPRDQQWNFDNVVDTLLEAFEAAKLRAVDPDVLAAYGHQMPAIYPPTGIDSGPQEPHRWLTSSGTGSSRIHAIPELEEGLQARPRGPALAALPPVAARRVPRRGRGLADPRPGDRGAFPRSRASATAPCRVRPAEPLPARAGRSSHVSRPRLGQADGRARRCRRFRSAAAAPRSTSTDCGHLREKLRFAFRLAGPAARAGRGCRSATSVASACSRANSLDGLRALDAGRERVLAVADPADRPQLEPAVDAWRAEQLASLRPARRVRRDLGGGPARTPLFGEQPRRRSASVTLRRRPSTRAAGSTGMPST